MSFWSSRGCWRRYDMAGLPAAIRRAGLGQDRPLEKHKVPAMYPFSAFAFEGGLSYGVGRGCFVIWENYPVIKPKILRALTRRFSAAMAKHGISGSRSALQRFFDRNVALKKPARGRAKTSRCRSRPPIGYESKACLTPLGWCLSTRPLSAQTWCGSALVVRAMSGVRLTECDDSGYVSTWGITPFGRPSQASHTRD